MIEPAPDGRLDNCLSDSHVYTLVVGFSQESLRTLVLRWKQ
jgi:hypothetical protein